MKSRYLLLLLPLVLAACSSDDDDSADSETNTPDTSEVDTTDPDVADPDTTTPDPVATSAGTYQFIFRNTSTTQPMTPPVVALHTPMSETGGFRMYEMGQPASSGVRAIAEEGMNTGLVEAAMGQLGETVSDTGVAFVDPANPGPILPGQSAMLTLSTTLDDQVMSFVSMVVCTNDGFSGVDSAALPEVTSTALAPVYDAGSEVNVLDLEYWVMPCGGSGANMHDDENGTIQLHPGQDVTNNPDFTLPADAALMEVTVTRN